MSVKHECPSCGSETEVEKLRSHTSYRRGFERAWCYVCDWEGMVEGERDREIVDGSWDDEFDIVGDNCSGITFNTNLDNIKKIYAELEKDLLRMSGGAVDSEQEAPNVPDL
jgi:hypothetical protein